MTNQAHETNAFDTSDIALAAALIVSGATLVRISLIGNGRKGVFHIANFRPETLSDYMSGEMLVEPKQFNNCVRQLNEGVRTAVAVAQGRT